ncbi:MAG: hypothetical protein AB7I18_11485 [Candidatus Berkiella sp.]
MVDLLEQLQNILEEYPVCTKAAIGLGALAVSAVCGHLYDWYYESPEKETYTPPRRSLSPRP